MIQRKKRPAGLTLIEVMIAMGIMIGLAVMVYMMLFSSATHATNETTNVNLDDKARETLLNISREVRMSGGGYTTNDLLAATDLFYRTAQDPASPALPPPRFADYTFGCCMDMAPIINLTTKTVAPNFGKVIRYFWRAATGEIVTGAGVGVDNNKDGLIDEGDVVRQETLGGLTTTTVVARNVSLKGLAFEPTPTVGTPEFVKIYLEVQGRDSKGRVLRRQSQTTVAVRN